MEFWGVEVKAGERMKLQPGYCRLIHLSQAALGEVKDVKGAPSVPIHLKIGYKSFVIGNLSAEDRPQLMLDLVMDKEFELSHGWKSGSVYFAGYMADNLDESEPSREGKLRAMVNEDDSVSDDETEDDDSSSDEEGSKAPLLDEVILSVDDEDYYTEEDYTDESSDEDEPSKFSELAHMDGSDFSSLDSGSDESSDEDEDEPSMERPSKKRPSQPVTEIPVPAKKTKSATPEKTGGKNGQAGKAPLSGKGQAGKAPFSAKGQARKAPFSGKGQAGKAPSPKQGQAGNNSKFQAPKSGKPSPASGKKGKGGGK